MSFSYGFPKHSCFQQDEMRKKQIKIVPSLLVSNSWREKTLEPIFVELKRFLLMLVKGKIVSWQLLYETLERLMKTFSKCYLKESYVIENIKNETR